MQSPNEYIQRKPFYFFLLFLAFTIGNNIAVYSGNQKIEKLMVKIEATDERLHKVETSLTQIRYEGPEQVIAKGFKGIIETTGLIDKVTFWIDNKWDQKLVDLGKLCGQPERMIINRMIGQQAAIDVCRLVH
jgi:hypothetical protein